MAFLGSVASERRREDAIAVTRMMQEITGEEPVMWGSSLVGFGRYSYTYASGRSGEWFTVGLSPRRSSLTIYLMDGFERHQHLLDRLGPHTIGKACLHIRRLDQIDTDVLRELITDSAAATGGAS